MTSPTQPMRPHPTFLQADWLFDGVRSTLIPSPTVVFENGRITSVKAGPVEVPESAHLVELPGATLMPGLIDAHQHLCLNAGEDPVGHLASVDDQALLQEMAGAAQRALAAGITTVRDLGDRSYLALELRERAAEFGVLPAILAAGPPITSPGGHCHFLGGEAAGVEGVRAAVRDHAERGVDVIKVMASGGNITPGSVPHRPQLDRAILTAAVEEAHRLGLPITAHAHAAESIADAVAAGVDGIEHATFMTEEGTEEPTNLIRQIAERRIAIGATVARRTDNRLAPPPAIASRMAGMLASHRRLHEAGVLMVAGSDAGVSPAMPHDVLPWAMVQLGELGFSPIEALWAMTSRAALACGVGHRKGRLTAGYDADVLAIDGNPVADPEALHRVRAVYASGRLVPSTPGAGLRPGPVALWK